MPDCLQECSKNDKCTYAAYSKTHLCMHYKGAKCQLWAPNEKVKQLFTVFKKGLSFKVIGSFAKSRKQPYNGLLTENCDHCRTCSTQIGFFWQILTLFVAKVYQLLSAPPWFCLSYATRWVHLYWLVTNFISHRRSFIRIAEG